MMSDDVLYAWLRQGGYLNDGGAEEMISNPVRCFNCGWEGKDGDLECVDNEMQDKCPSCGSDEIDMFDIEEIDYLKCRECNYGCQTAWGFYQCSYDGIPKVINNKCITRLSEGRKKHESV